MINKKKGLTSLLLILLLNLALNNTATVESQVISSVQYSDKLTPNTELSWKLKVLEIEAQGYFTHVEEYYWGFSNSYSMTLGDVFKIKIKEDPDDLNPDSLGYLFNTNESWADFYLNDDFIGDNAMDFYVDNIVLTSPYPNPFTVYILPITLTLENEDTLKVFQDYIYESLEPFEVSHTEYSFDVAISGNSFSMKSYSAETGWGYIWEYTTEIVYNTDWGVLSRLEVERVIEGEEDYHEGDYLRTHLLLEIENGDIRVPYNWSYGLISLFLSSLVVLILRKKRNKQ